MNSGGNNTIKITPSREILNFIYTPRIVQYILSADFITNR